MISLALAVRFDRKLTETVPAGVCLFMLTAYLFGITGHIGRITELFLLFELFGAAAVAFLSYRAKKVPLDPFKDPGNLVVLVLLVLAWVLSLHMRVTNFDDFHSWAITPKDIYMVNGLPTGGMASTFYRDYFPLVYFMDLLAFKLTGGFSESAMFFVLWALMIVSVSVLFHRKEEDKTAVYVCRVVSGIMLPFLFSFQFLHCLGTDILAALIFGAALIYIMEEPSDETFPYIRILLMITVLGMVKTTSAVLTAVCVALFCVRCLKPGAWKTWLLCALLPAVSGSFWLSWKIFCRIKGNTTYLSDNLNRNLSEGAGGLPSYAVSTAKEFFAKLFTYGLNDGTMGLTSAIILLIFAGAFVIHTKKRGMTGRDILSVIVILAGMAGYLFMMLYVYLFVFEEWEALSLSSYDRYIATYFGALLFAALYMICDPDIRPAWAVPVFTAVLAVTINYPFAAGTLIPSGYEEGFGETIAMIDEIEEEFLEASGGTPGYGESLLVVDHTGGQLRAKVIPYAAVPGVTRLVQPDENGSMPGEDEIQERAQEYGARIIELP